ncbi:unnamed protein product [marine sediment metagenome]|uniref:Uncharacterized protein n=1 Tax=marine sediment metagenome TaxID=412755 RepID=X0ZRK7_9ZZZZ
MFEKKIDLSAERKPGDDEGLKQWFTSRKYWDREGKKKLGKPPRDKEALFKRTKGNRKMPKELMRKIY